MMRTRSTAFVLVLAGLVVACSAGDLEASASVVGLQRGAVTLEVVAPPGTQIVGLASPTSVGEEGRVRFDVDLQFYEPDTQRIDFRAEWSSLFSEKWAFLDVALPRSVADIRLLPTTEEGFAFTDSSAGDAVASVGTPAPLTFGADARGHALLPIAAPGATGLTVGGEPVALDDVGFGTVTVDLLPVVLSSPALSGGTVSVPVVLTQQGAERNLTASLQMTSAQVARHLDRWFDAGTPTDVLPPAGPAGGGAAILWRRPAEVERQSPYAHVGQSGTVGTRYVAVETSIRERIRGCGFMSLVGIRRDVVLRDTQTGTEVARRSFPYPRRVECPPVVYRGQPDQLHFSASANIEDWLEAQRN